MAAQAQLTPQQMAQQNAALRQALLATAPRMRKNVITSNQGGTNGQTTRLKLFNVGVLTKLELYITYSITIGVAIGVPSVRAPWNLMQKVRLTDYDGTDRIILSGFQLFILNCIRYATYYGFNNEAATAVFVNPITPTAIASATGSFFIEIPVAFDVDNKVIQLQDLRGAIMMQTATGEIYLSIDWINSLYGNLDIDSLYAGGAATTVVGNPVTQFITVTMWQEYLLPQAISGSGVLPLPYVDLQTVYELNGNLRSTTDLAQNADKLISYPNVRSVIGFILFAAFNGAALQGNLNRLKWIANGNNILIDHSELSQLFYQRKWMWGHADLVVGSYWRSHRDHPIETVLVGNYQAAITPNVNPSGNTYIEIAYESFYTKGAALPGMMQSQ